MSRADELSTAHHYFRSVSGAESESEVAPRSLSFEEASAQLKAEASDSILKVSSCLELIADVVQIQLLAFSLMVASGQTALMMCSLAIGHSGQIII